MKKFLLILLMVNAVYANLCDIARDSLLANIEYDRYLTAGRHQFKSLWTRDFAWSGRGLLQLGQTDVVREHLQLLIDRRNSDGLVPKVLDSMKPTKRVINAMLSHLFGWIPSSYPLREQLTPYFVDENKSIAIDSNMMVLLTAIEYVKKTEDEWWWWQNQSALLQIYRYYDDHFVDGLIYQNEFSDWQDSVKRKGHAFLTNLIYYTISRQLAQVEEFKISPQFLDDYRQRIIKTFWDQKSGLFRSLASSPYVSLDGNLLALDWDFFSSRRAQQLFNSLRNSPFFGRMLGLPGWNTYPDYPKSWKNRASRLAGLPYHDRVYWSWLIALAGKITRRYQDVKMSRSILGRLEELVVRDGVVHEIYDPQNHLQPWNKLVYRSEAPFSWGAAFIVDALSCN